MEKKPSKKPTMMQQLMSKLGIDETLTKPIRYHYPKVKNQTFPQSGYNYQADLLELPTTKTKYNALLVVDDIYSNYCDFEPLRTKSALEVLKAFQSIFKRGIVTMPKASIRTDSGSEFKSVVDKYMHDHNILHTWTIPNRHKMLGSCENLNRQLGRIFMTYLSNKTQEFGKQYYNWTDIVDFTRHAINDFKKHPKDISMSEYEPKKLNLSEEPKYDVGDLVYRRIEKPMDEFGNKYHNQKFRQGDVRYEMNEPRKIVKVLAYTSNDPWRYILFDLPNVSYAEAELIPAKEAVEKFIIKNIRDKRNNNGVIEYLVHWKGYLVKDSTWESKTKLLEDGLQNYIQQYEDESKKKKK